MKSSPALVVSVILLALLAGLAMSRLACRGCSFQEQKTWTDETGSGKDHR